MFSSSMMIKEDRIVDNKGIKRILLSSNDHCMCFVCVDVFSYVGIMKRMHYCVNSVSIKHFIEN